MLSENEKKHVRDLLKTLDFCDLIELARTCTNGVIRASNAKDSIRAIVLHTADARSILQRKKITRDILYKYLHSKNISFPGNSDKSCLIELTIKLWQEKSNETTVQRIDETVIQRVNETVDKTAVQRVDETKAVSVNLSSQTIKTLAIKFAEWFYPRINTTVLQRINSVLKVNCPETLAEEDFWCDASVSIRLTQNTGEVIAEYHSEGASECLALLSNVCCEYTIFFSPNLLEDGIKGTSEPHGLVAVMCCGTLHSAKGNQCVGLYEQAFGLVKDPLTECNWKIKVCNLILRSQEVALSQSIISANQNN